MRQSAILGASKFPSVNGALEVVRSYGRELVPYLLKMTSLRDYLPVDYEKHRTLLAVANDISRIM